MMWKHAWQPWTATSSHRATSFTSGMFSNYSCVQIQGESVDSYVTRCPKFASSCEFVCMAKKKGEVILLQESSESEESILKGEEVSSLKSCGNRSSSILSSYLVPTDLCFQILSW